jgi:Tol biopolymer transport system component
VTQASEDGGAITYLARAPLGGDQVGNEGPDDTQVFSERGPGGWSSQDIQSPSEQPAGPSLGGGGEYRFFSSDLSLGLLRPGSSTALSPEVPAVNTIYLHDNPGGGYLPLLTAANVEVPGAKVGSTPGDVSEIGLETDPLFVGSTPDLSDVVFTDDEALTTNAVKSTNGNVNVNLYEWAAGKLQLVNVLPDGLPTTDAGYVVPALGFEDHNVRHAISNDGSRIVWSNGENGSEYGQHLYMRDTATRETIQLDLAHGVPEPSEGGAVFQTASSNGSKVFFTDLQKLTAGSTAIGGQSGPVDLYEFEVTSGSGEPLAGRLTDLTVDQHAGEMAGVLGLLPGASEDGSNVYFVANGVLAPGAAPGNCLRSFPSGGEEPRTCNLYLLHDSAAGWTTTFIATLSNEDAPDWGRDLSEYGELRVDTSRVSPSGRYLAFMSERSLTGYDNHDANSGMPDEEVFLYDASTNHLVCASCDPTGARPVGMLEKGRNDKQEGQSLIDDVEAFRGHWLAGNVPGWMYDGGSDALYQSRYLSDSGRLFFNSPDTLVPQATNGKENVYEYEPPASEETPASDSCTLASPTYSPSSGGCIALISSGTSAEESAFLDASESGDDVFFLTTSRLVPQDRGTNFNVYDAHVCSAAEPCATTPVLPPPCTTTDSCEPAPSPQPGIFGASGSATFSGAGNLAPPSVTPANKPKPLTRAQKLAKALKVCKQKAKKKRKGCEATARKNYGAKSKAKKSKAKKMNRRGK